MQGKNWNICIIDKVDTYLNHTVTTVTKHRNHER